MPEKSGEIAVTRKFIKDSGYKKGDHITVTPQDSASSSVSDSAESDNQTGENGSQMSDSAESDTQDGKRAARVTDSGESDNQAPSFPTELTIVGVVLDERIPFLRHQRLHVLCAVRRCDRQHVHGRHHSRERHRRQGLVQ